MISSGLVFAVLYLYVFRKEKNEKSGSEDVEGCSESDCDAKNLKARLNGYDVQDQRL
jgi:hypothetical protein